MIVDASVWVSYFLPGDRFHATTVSWLEEMLNTGASLAAPTLVLPEVAGAIARRSHSVDLGMEAAQQILGWPTLALVPSDEKLMMLSTRVASGLSIRGADAIYIATAEMLAVPLITWDREQRSRGGLMVRTRSPEDVR